MVAAFAHEVFGWRTAKNGKVVGNVADSDNATSIRIASQLNEHLKIPTGMVALASTGSSFESVVRNDLADALERLAPNRYSVEDRKSVV